LNDLRRGPYFFLDDSAVKRFGPFSVGEYREMLGNRLQIIGRTQDARSFTTTPLAFVDFETQRRVLKRSGEFYASVIAANALPAD